MTSLFISAHPRSRLMGNRPTATATECGSAWFTTQKKWLCRDSRRSVFPTSTLRASNLDVRNRTRSRLLPSRLRNAGYNTSCHRTPCTGTADARISSVPDLPLQFAFPFSINLRIRLVRIGVNETTHDLSRGYSERFFNLALRRLSLAICRFLAPDAKGSPGNCRKASRIDVLTTADADSKDTGGDAFKCGADFAQAAGVTFKIAHRVVAGGSELNLVQCVRTRPARKLLAIPVAVTQLGFFVMQFGSERLQLGVCHVQFAIVSTGPGA
jgi:hypothetical protein